MFMGKYLRDGRGFTGSGRKKFQKKTEISGVTGNI
jgi:hypothetical protein